MTCAYCDNNLRDVCPIRRAIDAGLPGLQAYAPPPLKPAERVVILTVAEVFRAFRASACRFDRTWRRLGINEKTFYAEVERLGIRDALWRIRARSTTGRGRATLEP